MGDFNATFLGEILTFMVLVWVTMKYVWPPIIKAINDRQQKIAEGLAAADRGKHDLDLAREKSLQIMRQAKNEAQELVEKAQQHVDKIIEHGKNSAKEEGHRLLNLAKSDIEREKGGAALELQQQTATLALKIVEKFLRTNPDTTADQTKKESLQQLIRELEVEDAKR